MVVRGKSYKVWTFSSENVYARKFIQPYYWPSRLWYSGVSGIEKYFDRNEEQNSINEPLILTLDSNIQYIINKELNGSIETFSASGGAALLMDVNNGDILSLVSLPNFDINQRSTIKDKNILTKLLKSLWTWINF